MNWFKVDMLFGENWASGLIQADSKGEAWHLATSLRRDLGAWAVTVKVGP